MKTVNGDQIRFDPYRLDTHDQCLWRDASRIPLRPKAFAVLHHLVRNAGRMITKEDLLEAVWPETHVADGALKAQIKEIRKALRDDAASPRFIQTLHRRGYRFIGKLTLEPQPSSAPAGPLPTFVGRGRDLARLESCLTEALSGRRRLVLVSGEPGIGKTTLAEAFLTGAAHRPDLCVARGQCLEQFGGVEAYLPLLDAIGRLCREPGRETFLAVLRRFAPTWLLQMPALVDAAERDSLEREVLGATPERMVREISEALEALVSATPLILVLEDLHWADRATVDVLNSLAVRTGPARMLVIGTYRPADAMTAGVPIHALTQELEAKGLCETLRLELLSLENVQDYLAARFPDHRFPPELAGRLHRRTEGNPLFFVNAVDYLLFKESIVSSDQNWTLCCHPDAIEMGVPASVLQMIERQLDRLPAGERRLLEAAAVEGLEFTTDTVAHMLAESDVIVEDRFQDLARRNHFVRPAGVVQRIGGAHAARYQFLHSLYQEVLYHRVHEPHRTRLHLALVQHRELAGSPNPDLAAELSIHSERGGDLERACLYLRQAAADSARRFAPAESVSCLDRALQLVDQIPPDRHAAIRMDLLSQRARLKLSTDDMTGAVHDYTLLADFAEQHNRTDVQVTALLASTQALLHFDRPRMLATVGQVARLRAPLTDLLRTHADGYLALVHLYFGPWRQEDLRVAVDSCRLLETCNDAALRCLYTWFSSMLLCFQSEYEPAAGKGIEARRLALEIGDAYVYLGGGPSYLSWALLHAGRLGEVLQLTREVVRLARKNQSPMMETGQRLFEAWVHIEAGDFQRARDICEPAAHRLGESGHELTVLFHCLLLLAKACLGLADHEAARRVLEEVDRLIQRQGGSLDVHLRLLFQENLALYWLGRGQFLQARHAADRLCEQAAAQGERSYLALGKHLQANIAIAQDQSRAAEDHIRQALDVIADRNAPLALARIGQTAVDIFSAAGLKAESDECRRRLVEALLMLAGSLPQEPRLRFAFLSRAAGLHS